MYVCGFVPSYLLPNKTSCSLDPFLSPLMSEIEEAFINGNELYSYTVMLCTIVIFVYICYATKIGDIESGPAIIRCLDWRPPSSM